jgi:hypothetical protein
MPLTVSQAIQQLTALQEKYGPDVPLMVPGWYGGDSEYSEVETVAARRYTYDEEREGFEADITLPGQAPTHIVFEPADAE